MAKLSALVIPAVIDTTGVDKGISQIRNKLSKVRGTGGGGGIGGGGGGGFSSGVTPFGGSFGGNGSSVSSGMAAAFGAAVGARGFDAVSKLSGNPFRLLPGLQGSNRGEAAAIVRRSTRLGRYLDTQARGFWNARNEASSLRAGIMRDAYAGKNPRDIGRVASLYGAEQAAKSAAMWRTTAATQLGAFAMRGQMMGRLLSSGAVKLAAGIGGVSLAYNMIKGAGSRQMEDRVSDLTRFQGSPMYTAMRNLKADYYNTPTPTASQGFFAGGRMGMGGQAPFLERAYTAIGDIPGGVAETAGRILGRAELGLRGGGTPEQAAASNQASAAAMNGTPVTMGGPLVVGMYKFFQKLFN